MRTYPPPALGGELFRQHLRTPEVQKEALMGFVNKVMLLGNTTRDAELRQLPTGTAVCEFTLATNRVYKTAGGEEKQETAFVDCTAFGRTAEVLSEYCPKG